MDEYLKDLNARELEKAKHVIGQFITSCSHSMRGPLKSITGLVNLLQTREDYTQEDIAMFLDLIRSTTVKMENTLDELEHFLENSKRKVIVKSVECKELVSAVLHQYEEEIKTKQIALTTLVDQSVPLYSDMARLRVVLSNLISNAIQFRDVNKTNQEVRVEIIVTPQTCTFLVTDNGIGIDPEHHLRIFELFFRATERSSGTGVGLYVVKEALDKLEGNITVDSAKDQGSIFKCIVPNRAPG